MKKFVPNPVTEPKNGIPFKNVFSKSKKTVPNSMICPICQKLIWNIVSCVKCGAVFCNSCINELISKENNSCPNCKNNPFAFGDNKPLKRFFADIKLKCPNSKCKEHPDYLEYLSHQENCIFRKYHCINDGCDFQICINKEKAMDSHWRKCPYRKIKCKYCQKEIRFIDAQNHTNLECDKFKKCKICHKEMTKNEYDNNHNEVNCLKFQVQSHKNEIKELKHQLEDEKQYSSILREACVSLTEENEKLKNDMLAAVDDYQTSQKKLFLCRKRKNMD